MSDIELEHARCRVCGADEPVETDVLQWRGGRLVFGVCSRCGLKYMSERPTQRWYARYYQEEFWQTKTGEAGAPPPKDKATSRQKHIEKQGWRTQTVRRLIDAHVALGPDSRVLEVGASWGVTLQDLKASYGCEVLAVEPNDLSSAHFTESFGIERVARFIEDLAGRDDLAGSVDLAIMSHVLENTLDPVESLEIIRSLLKDDGLVYIDTCNFFWFDAVNVYHPYIFSPDSLSDVLNLAGLTPRHIEHAGDPREVSDPDLDTALYFQVIAEKTAPAAAWRERDAGALIEAARRGNAHYRDA